MLRFLLVGPPLIWPKARFAGLVTNASAAAARAGAEAVFH
jgi:hypothetical protein